MVRLKQNPTKKPAASVKSRRHETKTVIPQIKKRRYRPGTVALRQLRREQKNSHLTHAIKKSHMRRILKEYLAKHTSGFRIGADTVCALREATEDFGSQLCGLAQDIAVVAKLQTPGREHYRFAGTLMLNGARRNHTDSAWHVGLKRQTAPAIPSATTQPSASPPPNLDQADETDEADASAPPASPTPS